MTQDLRTKWLEVASNLRYSHNLRFKERLAVAIPLLVTCVFPLNRPNRCVDGDDEVVFFAVFQCFWEEVLGVRLQSGVHWVLF